MEYTISLANEAAVFGALAAIQALLLNRFGLPFAAIPAFAGLGAYAFAVSAISGFLSIQFAVLAVFLALAMGFLANRLRNDHYLFASLATMECLGAWIGMTTSLGGREGLALPAEWSVGGPGFETSMLFWTLGFLIIVLALIRVVLSSAAGAAIDRIRENPQQAHRWLPDIQLRALVVFLSVMLASCAGLVYLRYHGRVSPAIFSLESALLVLVFTVMATRWPELAIPAAFLYSLLPYLMAKMSSLSSHDTANIIRICWGLLAIGAVVVPHWIKSRRSRRKENGA